MGHHRRQLHPAKTKLSSLCFAELVRKGKGGSQEGKWVSKEIERAAVLWCIALSPSGRGLLNWCHSFKLQWVGLLRAGVCVCIKEWGRETLLTVVFLWIWRAWRPSRGVFWAPGFPATSPIRSNLPLMQYTFVFVRMSECSLRSCVGEYEQHVSVLFQTTSPTHLQRYSEIASREKSDFLLHQTRLAVSVWDCCQKFLSHHRGGKSIRHQNRLMTVRVPREPKWNCVFNPIYMEHTIPVWKKRENEASSYETKVFLVFPFDDDGTCCSWVTMWRAWKWFVNAPQVFEFEKIK